MSSDLMVHELFRALESTIHERLNMIEDVIRLTRSKPLESGQETESDRIRNLEAELATMSSRLAALEMADGVSEAESVPIVHVNHVGSQGETLSEPFAQPKVKSEIWIEPMKGLEINLADTPVPPVVVAIPVAPATPVKPVAQPVVPATPVKPVRPEPTPVARVEPKKLIPEPEVQEEEEEEVEVADEEEEQEEQEEQEVVSGDEVEAVEEEAVAEEPEAEEESESEAEEDEEADEDEVALELEAFEYKGKTYYKDQSNQVYVPNPDDPEDVNETPVGVWSEERQRVLFKRA